MTLFTTLQQIEAQLKANETQQNKIIEKLITKTDGSVLTLILKCQSTIQCSKKLERKKKEEIERLRLEIRGLILKNGLKFIEQTPTPLRWIVGELEYGNEQRIIAEVLGGCGMTIGSETILKTGFTENQRALVEEVIKKNNHQLKLSEQVLKATRDTLEEIKKIKNSTAIATKITERNQERIRDVKK